MAGVAYLCVAHVSGPVLHCVSETHVCGADHPVVVVGEFGGGSLVKVFHREGNCCWHVD